MTHPGSVVRVLFVSSHAALGGSERYLADLLERLEPEWGAGVAALQDGPLVARLRAAGRSVWVVPTGTRIGLLRGVVGVRRLLRRARPQVVHANGVKAALVCVLAAAGTRRPVVWVKHDRSWDGPLGSWIARRCRAVVAVSEAVAAALPADVRARLFVVPPGVPGAPVDRAAARAAVRGLVGSEGPVVLLLGRMDRAKGQFELVEAAPRLRAAVPGVRLLLVGADSQADPGHRAAVRRRAEDLGVGSLVVDAGPLDDVAAVLAGADVVAVPSIADGRFGSEGFGLVGVEALAAGTPVVGYAEGALPEVLGDAALLVAPGDRIALADALARVLLDAPLTERLRARGRERHAALYRPERVLEAMRGVYRRVVTR